MMNISVSLSMIFLFSSLLSDLVWWKNPSILTLCATPSSAWCLITTSCASGTITDPAWNAENRGTRRSDWTWSLVLIIFSLVLFIYLYFLSNYLKLHRVWNCCFKKLNNFKQINKKIKIGPHFLFWTLGIAVMYEMPQKI